MLDIYFSFNWSNCLKNALVSICGVLMLVCGKWHCLQFTRSGWVTLISLGALGPAWQAMQLSLICNWWGIIGGLPGIALFAPSPTLGGCIFANVKSLNVSEVFLVTWHWRQFTISGWGVTGAYALNFSTKPPFWWHWIQVLPPKLRSSLTGCGMLGGAPG